MWVLYYRYEPLLLLFSGDYICLDHNWVSGSWIWGRLRMKFSPLVNSVVTNENCWLWYLILPPVLLYII